MRTPGQHPADAAGCFNLQKPNARAPVTKRRQSASLSALPRGCNYNPFSLLGLTPLLAQKLPTSSVIHPTLPHMAPSSRMLAQNNVAFRRTHPKEPACISLNDTLFISPKNLLRRKKPLPPGSFRELCGIFCSRFCRLTGCRLLVLLDAIASRLFVPPSHSKLLTNLSYEQNSESALGVKFRRSGRIEP